MFSTMGRKTSLSRRSSSGVRSTVSWYNFREMISWLSGEEQQKEFGGLGPVNSDHPFAVQSGAEFIQPALF